MPKLLFDARLLSHPGIGRYLSCLLEAMLSLDPTLQITLLGDETRLRTFKLYPHVRIQPCRVPIYSWEEQLTMDRFFKNFDLFHVPHFNAPLLAHRCLVVTIHDLIYLHVKAYQPFPGAQVLLRWKLSSLARQARRVIAVSQATAEELLRLFPRLKGKIRVIHEAAHPQFMTNGTKISYEEARSEMGKRFGLRKSYILSVGSIREHKNIQGLMKAYERLRERELVEADLVLVGRLDPRFEKKYAFSRKLRENPAIRYLGDLPDEDLRFLYLGATCFVFPSFDEGFGLPALEAMASGVPVVASRASSLPEVVGDAALLFNPREIGALERVLCNVLKDKELREELKLKGEARCRFFSWKKAASQTLDLYREALGESGFLKLS